MNSNTFSCFAPPFYLIIIRHITISNYLIILYSDHGGAWSVFSGDKSFDEPNWGFDTNDDVDSVWGLPPIITSKVCKSYAMQLSFSKHAVIILILIFFLNALLYKIRKLMGKEKITEKRDGKDIL